MTTEQDEAVQQAKRRLRRDMSARLAAVPGEDRHLAGRRAGRTLVDLLEAQLPAGGAVAVYAADDSELPVDSAFGALLGRGDLAFPSVEGDSMRFRSARPEALRPGTLGIAAPPAAAPEVVPVAVVVPGRAFAWNGDRLGRGRGYYDRALARMDKILKIGYCYGFQVVDTIPTQAHDGPMDWLVTDSGPARRSAAGQRESTLWTAR